MMYFDSWGFRGWLRSNYGDYSQRRPKFFTDEQVDQLGEIISEALTRWIHLPPSPEPLTAEQVLDLFLKRLAETPYEEKDK